jgi:hypothetical protein
MQANRLGMEGLFRFAHSRSFSEVRSYSLVARHLKFLIVRIPRRSESTGFAGIPS